MKIIELLNKIANNEEVPKKIKVSCFEFEWRAGRRCYENTTKGIYQTLLQDWLNNANKLNSEVKIIEEEKKIPEKLDLILDEQFTNDELQAYIYEAQEKVNQVIDYLKSKGDE